MASRSRSTPRSEETFLERDGSDNVTVADIDKGIKHKWLWDWLDLEDSNGQYLSEYIRKLKIPRYGAMLTVQQPEWQTN